MANRLKEKFLKILQTKKHQKRAIKIGYIFLFLFFLIYSPVFYNIESKSFKFDIDRETALVLVAVCLVFIVNTLAYIRNKEDSKKLNAALSEYADKEIVKAVLSKNRDVHFEGQKKKISIFFSDIQWFSNLSEKFKPEELVRFLKEYFSIMSWNIHKYNGYIDKYEWDCIMALWWAFHGMQKDSYNCCMSAIKQQKALRILNIKFKKTLNQEITVRMWIHTWEAVLGNIWARWKKIEYTAFWDCVNVSSRLEQANKYYGTSILVSEDIYNECIDFFDFREIDNVILKWKNTWVRIYELINEIWKTSKLRLQIIEKYEQALHLYYNWEYQKAATMFKKLKDFDPPSEVMNKRCKQLIKKAPAKNWNFMWNMEKSH